LYIVSSQQYIKIYSKGLLKYIPKKFIPKIKPKFLTFLKNEEETIIGKVIGIFLTFERVPEDLYIDSIVEGVNKYKEEKTHSIVFEDMRYLDNNNIKVIEKRTGLKVINGEKVLIEFMPRALKEIFLDIGEESINFEVLLITSKAESIKPLIKELSKRIRFLTIFVEETKNLEKVKEEILLETGLSIYFTKDIDKTLANYYIIINLNNNVSLNVDILKPESIIFDFSNHNKILKDIHLKNKKTVVINDFIFSNTNLFLQNEDVFELEKEIPSRLYELNTRLSEEDFKGFSVNGQKYSAKEIVST